MSRELFFSLNTLLLICVVAADFIFGESLSKAARKYLHVAGYTLLLVFALAMPSCGHSNRSDMDVESPPYPY